jgi:hypothetical protein
MNKKEGRTMNPVTFSGTATKRAGSANQIKLRISGVSELSGGVTVDLGAPFSGSYNLATKSAEVMLDQTNFAALNAQLAKGPVSFTLSVDSNAHATQFCFAGTCVPAIAGFSVARDPHFRVSESVTVDVETGAPGAE